MTTMTTPSTKGSLPTTWEDAAYRAASTVMSQHANLQVAVDMATLMDRLKGMHGQPHVGSQRPDLMLMFRKMAVSAARQLADQTGADVPTLLGETVELAIRKQHDYGHGNIMAFGIDGIIVRMNDKMARILNLASRGVEAANEPLVDSYQDMIGYSLIGLMLLAGTFTLPLGGDPLESEGPF